jgi:hypothetical protein
MVRRVKPKKKPLPNHVNPLLKKVDELELSVRSNRRRTTTSSIGDLIQKTDSLRTRNQPQVAQRNQGEVLCPVCTSAWKCPHGRLRTSKISRAAMKTSIKNSKGINSASSQVKQQAPFEQIGVVLRQETAGPENANLH